jgi:hypothetical protein
MNSIGIATRCVAGAILATVVLAAPSQAGVIVTQSSTPTLLLAGYTTWTLTATTDDGSAIVGFDFASQPEYGFFGPMNQLNPAGLHTIFQDANGFIPFVPNWDWSQDSQFKFNSNTLTVPAGFASESNSQLRAVFASATGWGTSVPFVQLAIPDAAAATVTFAGQVQTQLGSANPVDNNVLGTVPVPEPTSAGLLCAALLRLACVSRNRGRVIV